MFLNLEKYLNENFEPESEERKSNCVDLFQLDLSVLEKSIQNDFDSFSVFLIDLMKKHNLENVQVYKNANFNRQYFSKILSEKIKPSKEKLLILCVAMKINLKESTELLSKAGYSFSTCSKSDLIFKYFLEHEDYNLDDIYNAHVYFGQDVKFFKD
jgi:hypothetical protein